VRFQIDAAGRARTVEITRQGNEYLVTVDGRPQRVNVARTGSSWSLLIGPAEAGPRGETDEASHPSVGNRSVGTGSIVGAGFSRPARSYEVLFAEQPAGGLVVHVNGQPVTVSRGSGGRRHQDAAGGAAVHEGSQRVVAPMPGRVIKVLVKTGDAVAARQGLVVVEAMKMENELRSPTAGTVTEVRVTEGMSVEANAVLVVVD
jgi:biotin carboxyl carrier protein